MAHGTAGAESTQRHIIEVIFEEFRKVLPPTIFFAIGFNLIVLTQRILLSDYLLQFAGFMVATTTALVVGKAVLVADMTPLLRRFDNARLIWTILSKTVFYWACVFIARLLEGYVHFIIDEGRLVGFFPFVLEHFSWHRFLFIQIWIFVLFLLYTTGAELNQALGKGELRRILFARGGARHRPPHELGGVS
ncbi:MAG TPA: hypothetical protein VFL55_09395 [Acetobacteraceae bacterium]|nr:hypothetical protein [Acetobacteraceae bacterium]